MLKYSFFILLVFVACKSQQVITPNANDKDDVIYIPEESLNGGEIAEGEEYTEERILEEIEVTAPRGFALPAYNPTTTQDWDLIKTELDLRFDWTNEHVIGRAILTLKPYFYPQQFLMLDAKGMEIQSITNGVGQDLTFQYNGLKIDIDMNQLFTKEQEVELVIDYVAKPSEGPSGGSAAITSDKGLFFINPRGEEGDKPQQIWTQGETENNSKWFPTIDKPNERMIQKISLTVEDRFITLSNGIKVRSVKTPDGKRTDYWEMNDPHAPYLAMIAVGEFAVVKDKWKDIE
ncbi:MAG: aminopeptidase N, partial [Saprospiraceae bacterium]